MIVGIANTGFRGRVRNGTSIAVNIMKNGDGNGLIFHMTLDGAIKLYTEQSMARKDIRMMDIPSQTSATTKIYIVLNDTPVFRHWEYQEDFSFKRASTSFAAFFFL